MTVWDQLEPLLAKVQKPARYIGCEDGAYEPDPPRRRCLVAAGLPRHVRDRAAQPGPADPGEIINERSDGAAERGYAPWTDLEAQMRAHGVPLFSVDTHRAAADFDILAFNLSAELTYTNLVNMVDLAGCPVRAADRSAYRPAHRRRRPLHLQPRAHRRVPRLRGARRRRGGCGGDHRGGGGVEGRRQARPPHRGPAGAGWHHRACTCPALRRRLRRRRPARGHRAQRSGGARGGGEAHHRRPRPSGRTRSSRSCRSPRWCTTGSTSRCSGAAPEVAASARPA
jgi:hypothetical protein